MFSRTHRRTFGSVLALAALTLAGTAYAGSGDYEKPNGHHRHERTIRLVETSDVPQFTSIDLGSPASPPATRRSSPVAWRARTAARPGPCSRSAA